MVTFTRIPYAEAARRERLQDRIIYGSLVAAIAVILILFAIALVMTVYTTCRANASEGR
jgi:hypothetical protein